MPEPTDRVYQPERVIVGDCPTCGRLIVVHNDREIWPYIECKCGWRGATDAVHNYMRRERIPSWIVTQEPLS